MKVSSTGMRGWRKALGVILSLYFIALNAVIHSLHTHGPFYPSSGREATLARSRRDGHLGISAPKTCGRDDAPGTCMACRYLNSSLGSVPGPSMPATSQAPPERASVPETVGYHSNQCPPAFARAPPASL